MYVCKKEDKAYEEWFATDIEYEDLCPEDWLIIVRRMLKNGELDVRITHTGVAYAFIESDWEWFSEEPEDIPDECRWDEMLEEAGVLNEDGYYEW